MRIKAKIIKVIPLNEKCRLLTLQLNGQESCEIINVAVYDSFLQKEFYEFRLGENLLVEYTYESIDIFEVNTVEMIASYIENEQGEEVLNRHACNFPF